MKVNGVEDIKVEAEVEGDNPYVEGLVIDSEGGESLIWTLIMRPEC